MSGYLKNLPSYQYLGTPGRPAAMSAEQQQQQLRNTARAAVDSRLPGGPPVHDPLALLAGDSRLGSFAHPPLLDGAQRASPTDSYNQNLFPSYQGDSVGPRDRTQVSLRQPRNNNLAPDAHKYEAVCPECSFRSAPAFHPAAYSGCWKEIEIHIKRSHPRGEAPSGTSAEEASASADREEYVNATVDRPVEACYDNGLDKFSMVRTWSKLIDPSAPEQLPLPLKQEPICGRRNYSVFGFSANNSRTVRLSHDRGEQSLKLHHFSTANLSQSKSQAANVLHNGALHYRDGALQLGKGKDSLAAAAVANSNYRVIMDSIHPAWLGPQISSKFISDKLAYGRFADGDQVADFWFKIKQLNADRAIRKAESLNYTDIEAQWTATYGSASAQSSSAVGSRPARKDDFQQTVLRTLREMSGSKRDNHTAPDRDRKKMRKEWFCSDFNKADGCRNASAAGGCVSGMGRRMSHV